MPNYSNKFLERIEFLLEALATGRIFYIRSLQVCIRGSFWLSLILTISSSNSAFVSLYIKGVFIPLNLMAFLHDLLQDSLRK